MHVELKQCVTYSFRFSYLAVITELQTWKPRKMDVMFYCLREATSTYDVHIGFNYVWPVRWSVPWVLKEKKNRSFVKWSIGGKKKIQIASSPPHSNTWHNVNKRNKENFIQSDFLEMCLLYVFYTFFCMNLGHNAKNWFRKINRIFCTKSPIISSPETLLGAAVPIQNKYWIEKTGSRQSKERKEKSGVFRIA